MNKKNLLLFLAPLLLFAAGAGIFLYPAVSNLLAEKNQQKVIHTYEAEVENLDQEELDAAWEEAQTYNENLAGDPVHDPFIMGSGYVLPDNYGEVLNIGGDGVMGYIDIPKISVYLPVYHGTSEEVLAKGAGHLEMTALPVGGENRHSVISAHRGLPSARLFTDIDQLERGDRFYIHVLDEVLAYEVDQILDMVDKDDMDTLSGAMAITEGEDHVTLFTCTPYGVNTHRLLVRGVRVPYNGEEEVTVTPAESMVRAVQDYYMLYLILGLSVTLLIILILRCLIRPKRQRNRDRQADSGKK